MTRSGSRGASDTSAAPEAPLLQPRARQLAATVGLFIAATAVRAFSWPGVFRPEGILPVGPDSYYHLRRIRYGVDHFPAVLAFDPQINFPAGAKPIWSPAFDWVLAALTRAVVGPGDPAGMERLLVWIPPVLGGLTVVALYAIARRHFSQAVALLAAGLLCILPGQIHYSQLGYIDHHAAVALVTTLCLGAAMRWLAAACDGAPQRSRGFWMRRHLAVGVGWGVCLLVWPGSILHVAILQGGLALAGIAAASRGAARQRVQKLVWVHAAAWVVVAPFAMGAQWERWGSFSPLVLSNFQPLWLGAAGAALAMAAALWHWTPLGASRTRRVLGMALAAALAVATALLVFPELGQGAADSLAWLTRQEEFQARVAESMPLLGGAPGRLDWTFSDHYLSRLMRVMPFVLVALAWTSARGRPARLLLLGWTLALGLAALSQQRFTNSYVVAHALVCAWAFHALWQLCTARLAGARRIAATAALLAGVAFALAPLTSYHRLLVSDQVHALRRGPVPLSGIQELHSSLGELARWLRSHSPAPLDPGYAVLGPWGDGHVLHYVSERPVVQNNFGDDVGEENFAKAEQYFAERNEAEASRILEDLRVRYVLVRSTGSGHSRGYPVDSMHRRLYRLNGSRERPGGRAPGAPPPVPALGRHRLIYASGPLRTTEPQGYKLYEFVPGARVTGRAVPGSKVRARLRVDLPRLPPFNYEQAVQVDASGRYELVLPYPTEPFVAEAVTAERYRLSSGHANAVVLLREAQVRAGDEIEGPSLLP